MASHVTNWMKFFGLSIMLGILNSIPTGKSVLRFCTNNMFHQLKQDDCRFGLYFHEPVHIACFHVPVSKDKTSYKVWDSECSDPLIIHQSIEAQLNIKGPVRMIQPVNHDEENELENNFTTIEPNSPFELQCLDPCFSSTRSLSSSSMSSHEGMDSYERQVLLNRKFQVDKDSSKGRELVDQTLRLADYLYQVIEEDASDMPEGKSIKVEPTLRLVSIFKQSISITRIICSHPFIHENFLTKLEEGFLFLVSDVGISSSEDVEIDAFENIMTSLTKCLKKPPKFRFEGNVCPYRSIVRQVMIQGEEFWDIHNPELTADFFPTEESMRQSFPYRDLDVFIEFAWRIVDLVHGYCYINFKENGNYHHKFVAAMDILFNNNKIRMRWKNPTVLVDNEMWGSWFLSDVDATHLNLQACSRAAYFNSPFHMRLDRPIDATEQGKASEQSDNENNEAGGHKNKPYGPWPGQVYWTNYRKSGGVEFLLSHVALCFAEPQNQYISIMENEWNCTKAMS